ncbi:MAG: hypothetical protein GF383_00960 [Candidatus Lokiarchaeota archaeon]|nr:hypothetical protein [Candidatus Lokiarchaeota archaeon]MBD3337783.1 hypothetical protein [Candidatus Lokiarchaeota archaeon]
MELQLSKDKEFVLSRKVKKLLVKSSRMVDYNETYTKEICPCCGNMLEDNFEFFFEKGRKNKWTYGICIKCEQVICK